jgi:phosphoesterase RecJ-like protein
MKAGNELKLAKNILIITHVRPDGDCLSSACAFSLWLERIGKDHTLFCSDAIPEHYHFLPHSSFFTTKADLKKFDVILVLDCGCLARTGLSDELVQKEEWQTIIEIDHHPKTDDYSDIEIRLPEKSSTAEIVHAFFQENRIELDKKIADCLLTGLITDTGSLLFSSVNEDTIKTSSALILEGAAIPKIIKKTTEGKGLSSMRALGKILENLRFNEKYKIVYLALTAEDVDNIKKEFGNVSAIFDSVSDTINNVEGAKAALFLREEEPGKIRGSLRSKYPGIDISGLAEKMGGGGHPKAAAFRLEGRIERTEKGWKVT